MCIRDRVLPMRSANVRILLIVRRLLTERAISKCVHGIFAKLARHRMGARLIMATDSTVVAALWGGAIPPTDWHLLPIPHIDRIGPDRGARCQQRVRLWW